MVKLRDRAVIRKSMSLAQQSAMLRVRARRTVEITMTGQGNVDLYTQLGRAPTVYSFDKKAVGAGASKTITFTARAIDGVAIEGRDPAR